MKKKKKKIVGVDTKTSSDECFIATYVGGSICKKVQAIKCPNCETFNHPTKYICRTCGGATP